LRSFYTEATVGEAGGGRREKKKWKIRKGQ